MRCLVLLVALASAACLRQTEFHCSTNADCSTAGAVCQTDGYCSFMDSHCASGYRYGDLSGPVANQCVGGDMMNADGGVDGPPVDSAPLGCPGTYTMVNGQTHRYRLIATTATWTTQRTACAADGSNAYLAVPDNQTELQAIVMTSNAGRVWVGIDDQTTEGTYATQRGGTIAANDPLWDQNQNQPDNQPSSGPGEADCVNAQRNNAKLADDSCTTKQYPAVCECEP